MPSLAWLGAREPHLDQYQLSRCDRLILGCYGGTTAAGAAKNEDAAWLLCASDGRWELAMLLDAHATSQSAELLVQWMVERERWLEQICDQPPAHAVAELSAWLPRAFRDDAFRARAQSVQGETACLIAFRTAQWLYWFSVGDCMLYLLHPELMRLGQYALTQRQFYEWIGRVNTFDRDVPCYTSGVRELRNGPHVVLMLTDGVLECGSRPFDDPRRLAHVLMPDSGASDVGAGVQSILERVAAEQGRDSATVVAWACTPPPHPAAQPS